MKKILHYRVRSHSPGIGEVIPIGQFKHYNSLVDRVIPRKPRFSGKFQTFTALESSDLNKGVERRLVVYSQGSRTKVIEYLWLKFLWDELSSIEFRLFLAIPNTFLTDKKMSALRAILLFPKKVIRKRLNLFETLLGEKVSSRERYLGYKSSLDVEIYEFQRSLPRTPKYSGYCRTPSAVGSKSPRGSIFIEPLPLPEYSDDLKVDWYHLLTVGEIDLFSGRVIFHPDEY